MSDAARYPHKGVDLSKASGNALPASLAPSGRLAHVTKGASERGLMIDGRPFCNESAKALDGDLGNLGQVLDCIQLGHRHPR